MGTRRGASGVATKGGETKGGAAAGRSHGPKPVVVALLTAMRQPSIHKQSSSSVNITAPAATNATDATSAPAVSWAARTIRRAMIMQMKRPQPGWCHLRIALGTLCGLGGIGSRCPMASEESS